MTINCKGQLVNLDYPRVMGILNITPDSFYSGSRISDQKTLLEQAGSMLEEGATFLDIGGYSSRPGATDISEEEELQRVIPAVKSVLNHFPECLISVDTFRSSVARQSLDAGAAMVNDISAGHRDPDMISTVAEFRAPYILMHMKGSPQDMKSRAEYDDIILEMRMYFAERLAQARKAGLCDLILDPGFGFAKTIGHNFELLKGLEHFKTFNIPLLIGISRKSMIYKTLNIESGEALNGTTALHMAALLKGVQILRVHDVKEAVECITLANQLV